MKNNEGTLAFYIFGAQPVCTDVKLPPGALAHRLALTRCMTIP